MTKKLIALLATTAALAACLLCLPGCSSNDANLFKGEWLVENTQVTVVFTGDTFKTYGNDYSYTLDTSAHTITYTSGDMTGNATYAFSDDNKKLSLTENDEGGTKTTNFDKVSDDTSADPVVNYDSSSSSDSGDSANSSSSSS